MKRVKFVRNGYQTSMNDELAKVYKAKGKVEILSDAKPEKTEKVEKVEKPSKGESNAKS